MTQPKDQPVDELEELLLRFATSELNEMGVQEGAIRENTQSFTLDEAKLAIKQLIQAECNRARADQMDYVEQRLIGKNTSGDRVFYDKDAIIAENHLKDQQRVISAAMKAELQQIMKGRE